MRINRSLAAAIVILSASWIAACERTQYYDPPTPATQAPATITGSLVRDPDPLAPDTRVSLARIDGLAPRITAYSDRAIIAPGPHQLLIDVSRKTFFNDAFGFGTLNVELRAGQSYTLRTDTPVEVNSSCTTINVWIEAEDGTVASPKAVATIHGSNGFAMMTHGVYISVPSHNTC